MTGTGHQAIVAEIAALTEPPRLEAHEVTKTMLAERANIPPHKAANRLNRGVRLRELKMRKVKLNGKWTNAYSIIAPVTEPVAGGDDLEF